MIEHVVNGSGLSNHLYAKFRDSGCFTSNNWYWFDLFLAIYILYFMTVFRICEKLSHVINDIGQVEFFLIIFISYLYMLYFMLYFMIVFHISEKLSYTINWTELLNFLIIFYNFMLMG